MSIPVPVEVERLPLELQEVVRYICRMVSADATVEEIAQTINQTTGEQFVDRGDPAAADFDETDLTLDGNWHELDLSSIVPADASLVLLRGIMEDTASNDYLQFRTDGNSNAANVATLRAGGSYRAAVELLVAPSGQKIEYRGGSGAAPDIDLTVGGWWA